jgi:hypothetical protein
VDRNLNLQNTHFCSTTWRNGGMEEWRNGGMEEWRNKLLQPKNILNCCSGLIFSVTLISSTVDEILPGSPEPLKFGFLTHFCSSLM